MSDEPDRLQQFPPPDPDRVFYATGAQLNADDFLDEQLYHRSRLGLALAMLHGHGTVAGLRVRHVPAEPGREEELEVFPGLALDRYGRLIELRARACIRLDRWYNAQAVDDLERARHPKEIAGPLPPGMGEEERPDPYTGVVVDLMIRFHPCERGKTPAFAAGPYDATDALAPSRVRDGYELRLLPRAELRPRLPRDDWPDLAAIADPAERRRALLDAVYALWSDGGDLRRDSAPPGEGGAEPEPEQRAGPEPEVEYVDPGDPALRRAERPWVFLARLDIPAGPPAQPGERPPRLAGPVAIHDESRPLVVRTRALL